MTPPFGRWDPGVRNTTNRLVLRGTVWSRRLDEIRARTMSGDCRRQSSGHTSLRGAAVRKLNTGSIFGCPLTASPCAGRLAPRSALPSQPRLAGSVAILLTAHSRQVTPRHSFRSMATAAGPLPALVRGMPIAARAVSTMLNDAMPSCMCTTRFSFWTSRSLRL